MKYDIPKLRKIALVLENDGEFHRRWKYPASTAADQRNRINVAIHRLELPKTTREEREQLRRYFNKHWDTCPQELEHENDYADLPTVDIYTDNTPEPEPIDYSKLPDGTQLRLRNGWIYIKGRPLWLDTTHVVLGAFAGFSAPGTPKGWQAWYADGRCCTGKSPFDVVGVAVIQESQPDQPVTTLEGNLMDAIIEITTKTLVNGKDVATMSDSEVYDLIAAQESKIRELEKIETKPKKLVAEIEKRRAGIQALVSYLDSKE